MGENFYGRNHEGWVPLVFADAVPPQEAPVTEEVIVPDDVPTDVVQVVEPEPKAEVVEEAVRSTEVVEQEVKEAKKGRKAKKQE